MRKKYVNKLLKAFSDFESNNADFESKQRTRQFTTFFITIIEGVALHTNFFYMIFLRNLVKFFQNLKFFRLCTKLNVNFVAMFLKSISYIVQNSSILDKNKQL